MTFSTVSTVNGLRVAIAQARKRGQHIAFVPTMGALHAGHASLIHRALGRQHFVVVSIFVNPTQFRPQEDYSRYPRTLEQDQILCQSAGANLIFAPTVEEMYGQSSFAAGEPAVSTFIEVPGLSDVLEGASRPGHFRGVATVVAKLIHQVQPDTAYFGQKDAQQLAVIRRMVQDLQMPVQIMGCPTQREEDGLAMSSRNRFLNTEQRAHSAILFRTLCEIKDRVLVGERDAKVITDVMHQMLDATPGCERDYAVIVDPNTFQPIQRIHQHALALIAARFGQTRLIDNLNLIDGNRLS